METAAAAESPGAPARPSSPYVGLVPFAEGDSGFFFGRARETAIVAANLRANRLTIVYGPSGVGKSSLLNAGVVHRLRQEALAAGAEATFPVCVYADWPGDPTAGIRTTIQDAAAKPAAADAATLADAIQVSAGQEQRLLLVLDQFEEYFQYHPGEGGPELTGFAGELAAIVNDPSVRAHVLLSIREDAWAKLDLFKGHVPSLFSNYVRIGHLDLASARLAIEQPVEKWNETLPPGAEQYSIEPALIDAVLKNVAVGSLALTPGADAPKPADVSGERIEAPFLQLVMDRLWRDTVSSGGHTLALARLEALGGAATIVKDHLLDALAQLTTAEKDIASDCFPFLVSSDRTKIARSAADLADGARRPVAEITALLDKLCSAESGRILRENAPSSASASPTYELFHDILAEPILAWRRAYEAERRRRVLRRRLMRAGAVSALLIAVFAALSGWALIEKHHTGRLLHEQQTANLALQQNNRALKTAAATLSRRVNAASATRDQLKVIAALKSRNGRLMTETSRELKQRNRLDRRINDLRAGNAVLVAGIRRYNKANPLLATKINRLVHEQAALESHLQDLQREQYSLQSEASILKTQAKSLQTELVRLSEEQAALLKMAQELGFELAIETKAASAGTALLPPRPPQRYHLFPIPATLARSDHLRTLVEELAHELAVLLKNGPGLTQEIRFLRTDNGLLERQDEAVRAEIVLLGGTRARLARRSHKLQGTLKKASSENRTLTSRVRTHEVANTRERGRITVQARKDTALQGRNNDSIDAIGGTQYGISIARSNIRALTRAIAPKVNVLLREAEKHSRNPALAGLLAVAAYRVTPFGPDDATHPGVYNALWLALSHVDEPALHDLVARPTSEAKLGTTTSRLLVEKLCGVLPSGFTPEEWRRFLPAGAPDEPPLSHPCAAARVLPVSHSQYPSDATVSVDGDRITIEK